MCMEKNGKLKKKRNRWFNSGDAATSLRVDNIYALNKLWTFEIIHSYLFDSLSLLQYGRISPAYVVKCLQFQWLFTIVFISFRFYLLTIFVYVFLFIWMVKKVYFRAGGGFCARFDRRQNVRHMFCVCVGILLLNRYLCTQNKLMNLFYVSSSRLSTNQLMPYLFYRDDSTQFEATHLITNDYFQS